MKLDQQTAAELGFPKPQYRSIEVERRWLCREVPHSRVGQTDEITDLYVTGARLRLREIRPVGGGTPRLRITRKTDVDALTRLVTSIFLKETEFAVLAESLKGRRIRKLRHRLLRTEELSLVVDEFKGALEGLILAEAEFKVPEAMADFEMPDFAVCEVTEDPRFTGGHLVESGLPQGLSQMLRLGRLTFS